MRGTKLESAIDTLTSAVLDLDDGGGAAVLRLRSGDTTVSVEVRRGRFVSSSLRGTGQTFADYLLESGTVSREDFDRALRIAKEGETTLVSALVSEGVLDRPMLEQARAELAGRRFMDAVRAGVDDVISEQLQIEGREPSGSWPRPSTLLLEELYGQYRDGVLPVLAIPSYAVLRPTPRLGRYIGLLSDLMGSVPLPRVGGESFGTLLERHGESIGVPISVLLRTGMLMTEFEAMPVMEHAGTHSLEGIAKLLLLQAQGLVSMAAGDGEGAQEQEQCSRLGDLWLRHHRAPREAMILYEQARRVGAEAPVAGRLLPLLVMAGRADDPLLRWPLSKVALLADGAISSGDLLRALATFRAVSGNPVDALQAVHEAFDLEPQRIETLSMFVQLFDQRPHLIKNLPGVQPASFVIEAVAEARALQMPDLASHLLTRAGEVLAGNAELLEQALDLYRSLGWSADQIEVVVDFACDASRKGWTNPLWTLGAQLTQEGADVPLRLVIDTYELLVKASPNRREALDKLIRMVERLNQPNLLLDLLERSLDVLHDDEPLDDVYARLSSLYLEQFGDFKEASRYASLGLVRQPENPQAVQIVLRASAAGKLSRSSGYRFAEAMSRLSAIPTTEKLDWMIKAARVAEKELRDLPLALRLLGRIRDEYGMQAGKEIDREIDRLEGTVRGLAGERAALREGTSIEGMATDPGRVVEEAEAVKRLARISLQFDDGTEEACRLLTALLEAGVQDWDAVELALVKLPAGSETRRRLLVQVASSLDREISDRPPLPLLEEVAEALREDGSFDDREGAVLDRVHSAILTVSPFHRESVRYLGLRASGAGDVQKVVQFTERRIATARPQERGNLYVELASYGDLIGDLESRATTFWRIASNAMPTHPSVMANDLAEMVGAGRWSEAAGWLEAQLIHFPRAMRQRIMKLVRELKDRAGDAGGALETAIVALRSSPWDMDLSQEIVRRAAALSTTLGLAQVLDTLVRWHFLHPDMPRLVSDVFATIAKGQEDTSALVACAEHACSLPLPGTAQLVELFESMAGVLAGRDHTDVAIRCVERALVATSDPEKVADLILRVADLHSGAGEPGTEGLLLALMRASDAGVDDSIVEPWRTRALARAGLDGLEQDALRVVFARSVGTESFEWVDVLVAMFVGRVLGRLDEAIALLDEAQKSEDAHGVTRLAAVALREAWGKKEQTADALIEAVRSVKDSAEAAMLWLRISKVRKDEGREKDALESALMALELRPDLADAVARSEELALKLGDAKSLERIHDVAAPHLPGKKSLQAFHYRFAKSFENDLHELATAVRLYLASMTIAPKAGAAMESIERLSHRLQKHEPIVSAAALLRVAGRDRAYMASYFSRNTERFLEEENLASAYNLVQDAIAMDPGLDLVAVVNLMARRSQAGRASAQMLVGRWVANLESGIAARGDDGDLPRRLDAVAELRHFLVEGGKDDKSEPVPAPAGRLSVAPGADVAWERMDGKLAPSGVSEITFDEQPPPLPLPADEPITIVGLPEDSKITYMPSPPRRPSPGPGSQLDARRPTPPPPAVTVDQEGQVPRPVLAGSPALEPSPSRDLQLTPPGGVSVVDEDVAEGERRTEPESERATIASPGIAPMAPVEEGGPYFDIGEDVGAPAAADAAAARPVIVEPVAPAPAVAGPSFAAPQSGQAPVRPRLGALHPMNRFISTRPMPTIKPQALFASEPLPATEAPAQPPAATEAPAQPPAARPIDIVEAIGQREEVEPEVILRAETMPLPEMLLEELRALGKARTVPLEAVVPADDDVSVEVMIDEPGVHEFGEVIADEPAAVAGGEGAVIEERPAGQDEDAGDLDRATEPESGRETMIFIAPDQTLAEKAPATLLDRLRESPWDLDMARAILDEADDLHAHPSVRRILSSVTCLCDEDPGAFRPVRPVFKDSRSTLLSFAKLVGTTGLEGWLDVLGIVWDAAPSLFKERIGDYGLRTADQITPFSTGPVAPILEKAIRSLGYVRMGVYTRREKGYAVHVVRTTPPSIGVKVPMGRLPTSLEFYLGRCFWAVGPRRVLAFSLQREQGERTVAALLASFGPSAKGKARMDPPVASLAQDLWSMIPAGVQDQLRAALRDRDAIQFSLLQQEVKGQCTRAGILFSADLGSAVRHHIPTDVPQSASGHVDEEDLSRAIRNTPAVRDCMRFALSEGVLDFFDDVLD